MKKVICFCTLTIILLALSCKEEHNLNYPVLLDPEDQLPGLDTVSLQYNYLFNFRFGRNETFIKRGNEFVFYEGNYCIFLKYNAETKNWIGNFNYNIPENNYTERYLFNAADSIVVLGGKYYNSNYSIMSLAPADLKMNFLKKEIQYDGSLDYSCSTLFEGKLIVLLHAEKKIMIIDLTTGAQSYVYNYFKMGGDSYYHFTLSAQRNGYLYFYIPYGKKLVKMNLRTYQFEEIPFPAYIYKRLDISIIGGMVDNLFCFWGNGIRDVYCYDVDKGQWLNGGLNPFYDLPSSTRTFYSTEKELYINGLWNNQMLEIKKPLR